MNICVPLPEMCGIQADFSILLQIRDYILLH